MKRIILTGFLFTFLTVSLFAQHTENISVSAYDKINICCGIEFYLSEGEQTDLNIEVNDQNLLAGITTRVNNRELVISYDDKKYKRPQNATIKIYTSARKLSAIKVSSGAVVNSLSSLNANDMDLTATSGANINLDLHVTKLKCSLSSGSNIVLKGNAKTATLKATSGSRLILDGMQVDKVNAEASSGSDIKMDKVKELSGKASSGALISYSGNPQKVNKKESSGGTVRKK